MDTFVQPAIDYPNRRSVSYDQEKARVFNFIECSSVDDSHATFSDNYDTLTESTLSSMET